MRNHSWVGVISIAISILIAAFLLKDTLYFYSKPEPQRVLLLKQDPSLHKRIINCGLDIKGGTRFVLEIDTSGIAENMKQDVAECTYSIIQDRVNKYGVTEATVQKKGLNRLIVEIPGLFDPQIAKDIIQVQGRLEFRLLEGPPELGRAIQVIDRTIKTSTGPL
jgi:preprotein translocase subunit SecD